MEMKRKRDCNDILHNQQKKIKAEFINYISVPQLEFIAIIKVVTELCKLPDVRDLLIEQSGYLPYDSSPILECILEKLPLLLLPDLLKAKLCHVIRPISIQIFEWLNCFKIHSYSLISSLCWTYDGIVDKRKTVKQLIEANSDSGLLEYKRLYDLACTYCLDDVIPNLWEKLPEESKRNYLSVGVNGYLLTGLDDDLILYWSSVSKYGSFKISGTLIYHQEIYKKEHSICKNMFSIALHEGNIIAMKYFWEKLTSEEIICNLEQWINEAIQLIKSEVGQNRRAYKPDINLYQDSNEYVNILYFLMSKISSETQREVIQNNSQFILSSLLLFWPYQRFFLPTIETVWDSLDEKVYLDLVCSISKALEKYRVPVYKFVKTKTVLSELCRGSTRNLKKCLVSNIINDNISGAFLALYLLLETGDMGTVREMISHANVEEQKQIVEKTFKEHLFQVIIFQGNLNVIDQLIQQTALSESDIINLKEKIGLEWGSFFCREWIIRNAWEKVENFLNWTFTSQEKIDYFRYEAMNNKIDITYHLIDGESYIHVNRFISWCNGSKQEINQFKKNFAFIKPQILKKCKYGLYSFENFIAWISLSPDEINAFKQAVKQNGRIVCDVILDHNFRLLHKLINWFCHTDEEIQVYKAEYTLSIWFFKAVRHLEVNQGGWWAIKRLFHLFSPFSEEIKIKLKENITKSISDKCLQGYMFSLLEEDEYSDEDSLSWPDLPLETLFEEI